MAKGHIKIADIGVQSPGYSPNAWVGLVSEMSAIPAATAGVVSGDITFTAATPANGFLGVYNLPKAQSASSATVGEEGGLSENFSHSFFIPGDKMTTQQAIDAFLNQPLIVLAQDATQGGPIKMYGTEQNPAYVTSKGFESGTMADGRKGTVVTIFAKNKYDYTGTITEYDA